MFVMLLDYLDEAVSLGDGIPNIRSAVRRALDTFTEYPPVTYSSYTTGDGTVRWAANFCLADGTGVYVYERGE